MEEALLGRQGELSKLSGGKTTLKSLFSRGSKDEQVSKLKAGIPEL